MSEAINTGQIVTSGSRPATRPEVVSLLGNLRLASMGKWAIGTKFFNAIDGSPNNFKKAHDIWLEEAKNGGYPQQWRAVQLAAMASFDTVPPEVFEGMLPVIVHMNYGRFEEAVKTFDERVAQVIQEKNLARPTSQAFAAIENELVAHRKVAAAQVIEKNLSFPQDPQRFKEPGSDQNRLRRALARLQQAQASLAKVPYGQTVEDDMNWNLADRIGEMQRMLPNPVDALRIAGIDPDEPMYKLIGDIPKKFKSAAMYYEAHQYGEAAEMWNRIAEDWQSPDIKRIAQGANILAATVIIQSTGTLDTGTVDIIRPKLELAIKAINGGVTQYAQDTLGELLKAHAFLANVPDFQSLLAEAGVK